MWALFIGVALLAITSDVESRYTYQPAISGSITQHKVIATWDEARTQCHSEGAELAVPSSAELLMTMTYLISSHCHTTPYFIGVRATQALGRYVSVHNVSLDNMPNEVTDMIEKIDPRDGDCLSLDLISIRAVPCWSRLPFMCYKNVRQADDQTTAQNVVTAPQNIVTTTDKVVTTTENIVPRCESGYTFFPATGRCYKKNTKVLESDWNTANSTCAEEGGYLVIINDKAEAEFIMHELYRDDTGEKVWWLWTGIHDDVNGDWKSVLGEPMSGLYADWDSTSAIRENAHCGAFHLGGKIKKYYCDSERFTILCERDPIQEQDASTPEDLVLSTQKATVPYCDKGYTFFPATGRCYKKNTKVLESDWNTANSTCAEEGGYLVIINDKAEAEFIMHELYRDDTGEKVWWLWTGIHDDVNGDWKSVLGEPMSGLYADWDSTSAIRENAHCGAFHLGGKIKKYYCDSERFTILCERDPIQEQDASTPEDLVLSTQKATVPYCDKGYTFFPATGRCYKKNTKVLESDWNTANSTCAEEGGYLVIINDKAEAEFIMHELYRDDTGEKVWWLWTGIHDDVNGDWKSVLGDPMSGLYADWDGVPRENAHCGAFHLDGDIKKYYCDYRPFRILCERDPIQEQDATTPEDLVLSTQKTTVPYCDKGYRYYPEMSHCYKNHGIVPRTYDDDNPFMPSTRWSHAKDLCASEGGYLNIINDKAEADFIMNIMYPLYTNGQRRSRWWMWTALHDLVQGSNDWKSIDGEPVSDLYHNWDGFVSKYDVDPYCGSFYLNGSLRKHECFEKSVDMLVLCEKEPISI